MPYAANQFASQMLTRMAQLSRLGDTGTRPNDTATSKWSYRTTDTAAVVEAANYFDAATQLKKGDVIEAVMNNAVGQTPVLKYYVVTQAISNSDAHNVIALQATAAG